MKKEHVILLSAVAAALIIGKAYGDKIPLVTTLARKLPGSAA